MTIGGEPLWEVEYLYRGAGGSMADTTWFDPATLLPREQRRTGIIRDLHVRFDGTRAHLRRGPSTRGEPADTVVVFAEQPVFAGSLMDLVYRALPLAEGFRTRVPLLIPERGEVWWFHVQVTGADVVQTRNGPVPAWRVEVGGQDVQREVFWIARDTRLLLRIDHGDGSSSIP